MPEFTSFYKMYHILSYTVIHTDTDVSIYSFYNFSFCFYSDVSVFYSDVAMWCVLCIKTLKVIQ